MLISVSYYRGESKAYKYLENFAELDEFLHSFLEIHFDDWESLELTFFRGKEEERVRQQLKNEEKKDVKK